jgi:PadR family transcriptional regulator PadR
MGKEGLLGSFEELVLLAVARAGRDAYGMTVRREIEARTGRDVTIGAVYATLDRLESKGLLSSHLTGGDVGRGGRARRIFRVEGPGVEALQGARETRAGLWEGIDLASIGGRGKGSR